MANAKDKGGSKVTIGDFDSVRLWVTLPYIWSPKSDGGDGSPVKNPLTIDICLCAYDDEHYWRIELDDLVNEFVDDLRPGGDMAISRAKDLKRIKAVADKLSLLSKKMMKDAKKALE